MALTLKKYEYFYNKMVFCYEVLSVFIVQHLLIGGIALKTEFLVFVYELIIYLVKELHIFLIIWFCNYYHYYY